MNLKDLSENVTKTKYEKYLKVVEQSKDIYEELANLDMNNEKSVNEFITKTFGEPKGIYTNNYETQVKLVRRLNKDMNKNRIDVNFIRPDFSVAEFSSK